MALSPSPVGDTLRRAGWYEGRDVANALALPLQFAVFPKAQEVLAEFGGLYFGSIGAGTECATSEVKIDPNAAIHLVRDLQRFERMLRTKLYPLGELDGGHGYLVIDEEGRTYVFSAMSRDLRPLASTFSECLELLLLGKRLSRHEIEATWPEAVKLGSGALYSSTVTVRGRPANS